MSGMFFFETQRRLGWVGQAVSCSFEYFFIFKPSAILLNSWCSNRSGTDASAKKKLRFHYVIRPLLRSLVP